MSGKLISIEGIDGTGKSTLIKELAKRISALGVKVVQTKEPGGTPIGKRLIDLLHYDKDEVTPLSEFFVVAAARAHHFQTVVIPALERGELVISDRMADSSLAYQGYGRGVDLEIIKQVNAWAMSNVRPDAVLYIDLDWQTAKSRIDLRKKKLTSFEKEKDDFWHKVKDGFETIFSSRHNVIRLDGKKSVEQLCNDAMTQLTQKGLLQK